MADTAVMARRLIKQTIASALCRTGVPATLEALRRQVPLVTGYHRVVEDFDASARQAMPAMLVSRDMLERHLDCIGRRHDFIAPEELGKYLHTRPARPVALVTFDDGYRDVYEHAWPLLKRKGIPACLFVISDLVGTDRLQLHDELYLLLSRALADWPASAKAVARHLARARVPVGRDAWGRMVRSASDASVLTLALLRMSSVCSVRELIAQLSLEVGPVEGADPGLMSVTWPMVAEMSRGGMTIGSHTRSHARLPCEPLGALTAETRDSRYAIESQLGAPVRHFAYPDGAFNRASVRAVADAGYEFGYTTCAHRDAGFPDLTVPRFLLWERSSVGAAGEFVPDILECQVQGVLQGGRSCTWQSHQ